MSRVISDYLRRWWWVYVLVAIVHGVVCWFAAWSNDPLQRLFFPYAVFAGAFLLAVDLQRGHARALLALPMTTRQVARSFWMVGVAWPAAILTGVGCVSAGLSFFLFHGNHFRLEVVAILSIVNILWLGAMFYLLTGLPVRNAVGGVAQARGIIFGALWGLSIGGGMAFGRYLLHDCWTIAITLVVLTAASIMGWFQAERFVLERAGIQRPGIKSSGPVQYRVSRGFGGLFFMAKTTLIRSGLAGLGMFAFIILFMLAEQGFKIPGSREQFFGSLMPVLTNFPFWIVVVFQVMPMLMQLRLLRSMPVSTVRLAAVLVFLPMFSIMLMGLVWTLVGVVFFSVKAFAVLVPFTLSGAAVVAVMPLMVWRGCSRQTFFIAVFAMVSGIGVATAFNLTGWLFSIPIIASLGLGVASISYLLTYFGLRRSRHAYVVESNMMAGWGNWGGR